MKDNIFEFSESFFSKHYEVAAKNYKAVTGLEMQLRAEIQIYNEKGIIILLPYKLYTARLIKIDKNRGSFETYFNLNEAVIIKENKIYRLINDGLNN